MKVVLEKKVRVIHVEYENSNVLDRNNTYNYLDKKFGLMNYSIKRSGPHPSKAGTGLMIIEVDLDSNNAP